MSRFSRSAIDPATSRIDNQYYDHLGDEWWDTHGNVGGLHAMNPARADYFQRAIEGQGGSLRGARILDVGCGGGILAEELARRGADVTGVDRSVPSLDAALRHRGGLAVRYAGADAAAMPFADGAFDGVISSDFLEHVFDLDAVSKEIARVVKPGGFVCFDTINRTLLSRVVVIWVMEIVARRIPRHTHDWKMFVTPGELTESFARAGLVVGEIRGLGPTGNPLANLRDVLLNRTLSFQVSDDTRVSFVGVAAKK